MTIYLYECLKAVGLQRHYARFTSMGVCSADLISGLSMVDYPHLGIRSMEDRIRLFQLVQLMKNHDPNSIAYDDGNESSPVHYGNLVNEVQDESGAGISNPDVHSFTRPSHVRRRLDFIDESADLQQRPFADCADTVHAVRSHKRNNKAVQEQRLAMPMQLQLPIRNDQPNGKQESSNCKLDVHAGCCQCDYHAEKNNTVDIRGANSTFSFTRLPPNSETNPKCSPATLVMPKTCNTKSFKHKDKNITFRNKKSYTDIPVFKAKRTAGYNYGLPLSSTYAPRKKQNGGQRISVCVRKRPLIHAECRRGEADVLTTPGGECVIVHENKEAVDLTQYILQHKFYFDQVFGEESSNEEVYQRTTYPLVQHMLSGGESTCFAYGQTGAGKTYTMLGSSPGKPGLYALAARDIFAHLSTTYKYSSQLVYVSFFEIYCGQLYDLLNHRKRLFAREDGQKVVHISRLRDLRVDSVSSLLEVISQGTAERTQGMSGVNPLSSRSHALLQIQLRDSNQQITGRMWFVDLAGSERASDAKQPDRQSRIEGAEINQSLLALKECIRSLDREESHTPFRQSKLTLVLKDSFVGDSMTCMIANLSPGQSATEHTLNTLRYADRVKELRKPNGIKGRSGSKMVPSLQHCRSKTSSSGSVGNPKRTKSRKQSETFSSDTPTTKLHTGSRRLCSTPKYNICGEETQVVAKNGLEYITPVRSWLVMDDKRHESKETNERGSMRVNESYGETHCHFVREKSAGAENDEQQNQKETHEACFAFTEKESGFYSSEKESRQHSETRGLETEWVEPRRQDKNSINTSSEVAKQSQRGLHIYIDDMERKRHLRRYHQQLQRFIPSSGSPSAHFSSSLPCPSFSSYVQGSLSSTQQSSHLSLSAQMYPALGDISAAYRARVAKAGYKRGQRLSSDSEACRHKDVDSRVSLESTEASFRQDWCENKKRGPIKTGGETKSKTVYKRPAGINVERKCSWVAATEMEPANRMTSPISRAAQMSQAEELNTSEILNDVWRTKQKAAADCYSMESTCSDSVCSHPSIESQYQQAPAEKPLSPPYEHTYTLLTPNEPSKASVESKYTRCNPNIRTSLLQNAPEGTIQREKAPCSVCATLPVTTTMTDGCTIPAESLNTSSKCPVYTKASNCPVIKSKTSVLPQDETYQQAATASVLQENNSNTFVCPVERKTGDSNRYEIEKECLSCAEMEGELIEDVEYHMPQEKTLHPTDSTHTERRIHIKNDVFGIGTNKPHIPEFTLSLIQNQEDSQKTHSIPASTKNVHAPPPKSASCASVHTSLMLPSVQHLHNTGLPSLQNPSVYACDENKGRLFSFTPQQSGGSPAYTSKLSNQSSHSYISPKPNYSTEFGWQKAFCNQGIRPTVRLLTLEDLNHVKWCIVKAHLEQMKDMEDLCCKEKKLLYQQHDMAFGEYVHKLAEIMERKSRCAHSMKTQLQPFLKYNHSMKSQQSQRGDADCDSIMWTELFLKK